MELRQQIQLVNAALSGTLDLYRIWAKKNNLNYNALLILYTLEDYGTCTQKQICECWALPKQTVHGILQDFEKQGYITVSSSPSNKKERLVTYTQAGIQFASSVLSELHQMEEHAMQELGAERCQQLISSNTAYYQFFKKEIENGLRISKKIHP